MVVSDLDNTGVPPFWLIDPAQSLGLASDKVIVVVSCNLTCLIPPCFCRRTPVWSLTVLSHSSRSKISSTLTELRVRKETGKKAPEMSRKRNKACGCMWDFTGNHGGSSDMFQSSAWNRQEDHTRLPRLAYIGTCIQESQDFGIALLWASCVRGFLAHWNSLIWSEVYPKPYMLQM